MTNIAIAGALGIGALLVAKAAGKTPVVSSEALKNRVKLQQKSAPSVILYRSALNVIHASKRRDLGLLRQIMHQEAKPLADDAPPPVIGRAASPNWLSPGAMLSTRDFTLGNKLTASNGLGFVELQTDGNLVLRRKDGTVLWNTETQGKGIVQAVMQTDGNLVLQDVNGSPVWATATQGNPQSRLVIQDDGNLVLYRAVTPTWATNSAGWVGSQRVTKNFLSQGVHLVSDAVDEVITIVEAIPIAGDAIEWLIGLVKDFANTDVGKDFFRVVSPAAVPILFAIPFIGPVLAPLAYAFPGIARGERLDTAYANELVAAVKYFSEKYAGKLAEEILLANLPVDVSRGLSELSNQLEDVARLAGKEAGKIPDDPQAVLNGIGAQMGLPVPTTVDNLASFYAIKQGVPEIVARATIDNLIGLPPPADISVLYDPNGTRLKPIAGDILRQIVKRG